MKKSNIFRAIRNSFLVISIVMVAFVATASNKVIPVGNAKSPALHLTENSIQKCVLNFNFAELQSFEVSTQKGMFNELTIPGLYSTGKLGEPKLPAARKLIEIPFGATPNVKVVSFDVKEYKLADYNITNKISPVQLPLSKSDDPTKVPFQYNEAAYSAKGFNANELASIEVLGTLRGIRLANVNVNPVVYNPSNGTIKVYNNLKVEITFEGSNARTSQEMRAKTYSPYFEAIYKSIVNDRGFNYPAHPDLTKYPVKYLIIANRMFEAQLAPFIEWKTKKGFKVVVAYTDIIGTTPAAIKSYVATQYNAGTVNDPAPSFCLIVGDVDKVPASFIGSESDKASDLGYFSIDGDMFPEIYYGRFSASTTAQLQPQIDKTLYYEKYQFADPTYLDNVTLIAGEDGTWNPKVGVPTINYGTANYFNTAHQFNTINVYLNSYTNCYNTINGNGVGFFNYTAHGSETSFQGPSFSQSGINALTNANKYPTVIGNCCLTGDFGYTSECFGETWLRAENKGAVAYIGSSPSSYWWEDFYWSVGSWNVPSSGGVTPTYAQTTWGAYDAPYHSDYVTNDALIFIGNLAVTEAHNASYQNSISSLYYWQAYCLFGDPSLSTYLTQGEENNVSYPAVLPIGMTTFKVNAEPRSYVAISFNGELKGVGLVDSTGEVNVELDPITNAGMADIVVTRPQFKPVVQQVLVAPLQGAYVAFNNYTINDQTANNNGVADYNETVKINAVAKNVGKEMANNVNAVIRSTNPYVTIIDSTYNFGNIDTNASVLGNNAFEVKFAENTPDNQTVKFAIQFKDSKDSIWKSSFSIKVNAPIFAINSFTVTENAGGNNNGRLDPGETGTLKVNVKNNGHAKAINANTRLFGNSVYLTLNPSSQLIDSIAAGQSKDVNFTLTANTAANQGTLADVIFDITSGHYITDTTTVTIGQSPIVIIGNGTAEANKYPFYNYYENNKTQIIYTEAQLGGSKKITKLGFDISNATADASDRILKNLTIKIKDTNITKFNSAYTYTGNATTVFSSASYTMPGTTGWHMFDITDYNYDGTGSLVIEVVWGDNGNYCASGDEFKVKCTDAGAGNTRVAYGYADSETPPAYDATSTSVPNIKFEVESSLPSIPNNVKFVVMNGSNNLIQDAFVTVGSMVKATNSNGEATFQIVDGQYNFAISKDGYNSQNQIFTVDNDSTIDIILSVGIESINKTELVKIYPNPNKGRFNVVLNASFQNTIISVYDAKGQSVYSEVVTNVSNEKSIDLSNLDKGVYIIRVVNNNKATYNKLIIE